MDSDLHSRRESDFRRNLRKNETQIGNKEIRKQRKKDEKEVSCDELVDDVFDDVNTTLLPAHLIQVRVVCHLNNMSKRVRSKSLLFLLIVCLDHCGFMAS